MKAKNISGKEPSKEGPEVKISLVGAFEEWEKIDEAFFYVRKLRLKKWLLRVLNANKSVYIFQFQIQCLILYITNTRIRLPMIQRRKSDSSFYLFHPNCVPRRHRFLCNRRINNKEIKYLLSACNVWDAGLGQVLLFYVLTGEIWDNITPPRFIDAGTEFQGGKQFVLQMMESELN